MIRSYKSITLIKTSNIMNTQFSNNEGYELFGAADFIWMRGYIFFGVPAGTEKSTVSCLTTIVLGL